MDADQTLLPISPHTFWGIVLLSAVVLASVIVFLVLPRETSRRPEALKRTMERLGAGRVPVPVFLFFATLWFAFFVAFVGGLLWVLFYLTAQVAHPPDDPGALRWTLLTMTTLTAAASAVVALPFTLIRTHFNRRSTEAEEEGLLTDRINKAVEGLGAQKEVRRRARTVQFQVDGRKQSIFEWEDQRAALPPIATNVEEQGWSIETRTEPNLEVRIGAIYALERIAQRNTAEVHVQVMEILCAYIRENAPAKEALDGPVLRLREDGDDGSPSEAWKESLAKFRNEQHEWKAALAPRIDIQIALEVIGRRKRAQRAAEARHLNEDPHAAFVFDEFPQEPDDMEPANYRHEEDMLKRLGAMAEYRGYRLDLRNANLQGAKLSEMNFAGALADDTRLEGADLEGASLRGARLSGAGLQGASLVSAHLQGAHAVKADLQGVNLDGARAQWVTLTGADLSGASLHEARMYGAALDGARLLGAQLRRARLQQATLTFARLEAATFDEAWLHGAQLDHSRLDETSWGRAKGLPESLAHLAGQNRQPKSDEPA